MKVSTTLKVLALYVFSVVVVHGESWAESGPFKLLADKIENVKAIIDALPQNFSASQEAATQEKIKKELEPLFSETKASELSINPAYWAKFSPQQKERYKNLLREIIVNKFASGYETEKGKQGTQAGLQKLKEKVLKLDKEGAAPDKLLKVDGARQVYATLPGDELDVPLKFMFYKEGDDWKIYDVYFDGKSLIFSYRRQFQTVLDRQGVEGLLKRLQQIVDKNKTK